MWNGREPWTVTCKKKRDEQKANFWHKRKLCSMQLQNQCFLLLLMFGKVCLMYVDVVRGHLVDLSWPIDEKTIFWTGLRPFQYTKKIAEYRNGNWYASNEFCMAEHGGTHLDAPFHFNAEGWKVGEIPTERLLAHGVVVDISAEVKQFGPEVELRPDHLEDWRRTHGPLPNPCVLFVRFGWSKYYSDPDKYLGKNGSGLNFPGISREAAQWIAESQSVIGVGVDTPSVDKGASETFDAHKIFAQHKIYNLENVDMTTVLPVRGFEVAVMPLKLKEGSGAPVRIVAFLKQDKALVPGVRGISPQDSKSVPLCIFLFLMVMYV